jgi:purine-binding chemotaxis protein CheW
MVKEISTQTYAEPQTALTAYLESLLRPELLAAAPPAALAPTEPATAPAPEPRPEADRAEPTVFVEGVPGWAQAPFQCLLFKTAGLTLGIPLFKLNGITPWSSAITPMPGHSPSFLGLLPHLDRQVKVVDTSQVVMPKQTPSTEHHYIVLIAGGEWGLTCESVSEVVTLHPDQVRWRTAPGIRPWLAGIVKDRMCALLDADELVTLLTTGEQQLGHKSSCFGTINA